MVLRWTAEAVDDLERICDYIAESRPGSAQRVAKVFVDGISELSAFPNRGRLGRVDGSRELVFAAAPVHRGSRRSVRRITTRHVGLAGRSAALTPRQEVRSYQPARALNGLRIVNRSSMTWPS